MRYRISDYAVDRRDIIIEDILELDEVLADDSDKRYGLNLCKIMKVKELRYKLLMSILACNSIINFECKDGIYYIDWVELKDKQSVLHRDSFEIEDERLGELTSFMNRAMIAYGTASAKTNRKVFKRAQKYPFEGLFGECVCLLDNVTYERVENGKNDVVANVPSEDSKLSTEIYSFIKENKALFKNIPVAKDSWTRRNLFLIRCLLVEFRVLLLLLILLDFVASNFLGVILLLGLSGWSYNALEKSYEGAVEKFNQKGLTNVLESLEKNVDFSTIQVTEDGKQRKKGRCSFSDFVKKDFDLACDRFNSVDSKFEFQGLNEHYSCDKVEEACGNGRVYKVNYISRLLEAEKRMYALNKKCGLMTSKPSVSMTYLYEILEFLGWTREEARSNEFIRYIHSSMRGLYEHAYEGCEVELVSLIELAVLYAGKVEESDTHTLADVAVVQTLMERSDEIFRQGEVKINQAYHLERMADQKIATEKKNAMTGSVQAALGGDTAKKMEFRMQDDLRHN